MSSSETFVLFTDLRALASAFPAAVSAFFAFYFFSSIFVSEEASSVEESFFAGTNSSDGTAPGVKASFSAGVSALSNYFGISSSAVGKSEALEKI